jgi:hypothetical protein
MPMVKKTNELVHRKSSFFCLRVALLKFRKTMAQPAPPVSNPPPPGAGVPALFEFMAKTSNNKEILFSKTDLSDGFWRIIVDREQR